MDRAALTGTRIRERRIDAGLRQAALARAVGISAAYLNLIEHNRRRIGGKVLIDIARALDVEPSQLTEGAGAELVDAMRGAAADTAEAAAEPDRAEELAGRFPGWARLIAAQRQRIDALERVVETLSDRLTHDPHLASALHDVLSTATAIRATSAILADGRDIEPGWQARFHRNLYEDSQRLAASSQALVSYLDAAQTRDSARAAPQEEVERWLEAADYRFPALERAVPQPIEAVLAAGATIRSEAALILARDYLERYVADAGRMPFGRFSAALDELGLDPPALADRFGVQLSAVLRRLATLPPAEGQAALGIIVCDGSGALTFRKPVEGFGLPRFGAACPLWPLYQALSRPMVPVRTAVEQPGRDRARFLTFAIAEPKIAAGFDTPPVYEATMLIVPEDRAGGPLEAPLGIGTSCRVCPREACVARREPSVLAAGA